MESRTRDRRVVDGYWAFRYATTEVDDLGLSHAGEHSEIDAKAAQRVI
jgi:hypothetical protein